MRVPQVMAFVLSAVFAAPAFVPSTAAEQGIFERFTTREVTVPAGTQLPIILDTSVASNTSRVEQPVRAHLSRDVRLDNEIVIPAGSELYGNVTAVRRPGKVKGRSYIAMRLDDARAARQRRAVQHRYRAHRANGPGDQEEGCDQDRRSRGGRRSHWRAHRRQEGRADRRRRRWRRRHGRRALHARRRSGDRARRTADLAAGFAG